MKLLGHPPPAMTLFYLQATQADLQQEFFRAAQTSPHTLPLPAISSSHSLPDALRRALHFLDAFRTKSPSENLDAFRRRLLRLIEVAQKLTT